MQFLFQICYKKLNSNKILATLFFFMKYPIYIYFSWDVRNSNSDHIYSHIVSD